MNARARSKRTAQLVLSIDLDFFVSPIAHWKDDVERPADDAFSVDDPGTVQALLERQCLLQISRPVQGTAVTHHHQAFFVLRQAIARGSLRPPFDLIHLDAHSDLGMGDAGYVFILSELLKRPIDRRAEGFPDDYTNGLTFGNWIAFVIANRWITSMTLVTHPDYSSDLLWMYFKDTDVNSGVIQMRPRSKAEIKKYRTLGGRDIFASGATKEPPVSFKAVPRSSFQLQRPPDLTVVSHSPGYTPRSADVLLDLIRGYIRQQD